HGDTSRFLGTPLRKRHASIVEVMRRLAVLFCLPALLAASEPVPKLADIDRLWALRAEGSTGGRALSSPIDLTIDASRAVLAAEPESLEARRRPLWSLSRMSRGTRRPSRRSSGPPWTGASGLSCSERPRR